MTELTIEYVPLKSYRTSYRGGRSMPFVGRHPRYPEELVFFSNEFGFVILKPIEVLANEVSDAG